MEVYNQILELYTNTHNEERDLKRQLEKSISKANHLEAAQNEIILRRVETFKKDLKDILKKNFQYNLEQSIQDTEILLAKESDFAKSAWEMYGSELAGDFNAGEVKAQRRLSMLKEIIK